MPHISKKQFSARVYDQKHLRNLSKRMRKVQALIDEAARKGASIGARTGYKNTEKDFRFDDFPQARREIDAMLKELSTALTLNVQEANSEAWGMANKKNDAMVSSMLASTGIDMAKRVTQPWFNKNERALGAFQKRVAGGMGLSTDVWNLRQFKGELEMALEIGLGSGESAAELSRDVRSFLKYPDKLFRRVRDEKGVLRLSRAASEFHPGQGVYRSSYKNALRLTATETNMAYRKADSERWQQIPFVLGIEIHVSKTNHPVEDICDELDGDYPKDFVFTGWHPFCKCFATSKLPTPEQFMEYQQAILDGKDVTDWNWEGEVKDVPENFKDWVQDNEERISNAKSLPYFMKDNEKYLPEGKYGDGDGKMGHNPTREARKQLENHKENHEFSDEQLNNFIDIKKEAGYDRGAPMTFDEADNGQANLSRNKNNCAACVMVHELRLRGYNITALPFDDTSGSWSQILSGNTREAWLTKKKKMPEFDSLIGGTKSEILAKVEKLTQKIGSRYHLGWDKKIGGGHIITVERTSHGLVLYCPQRDTFYSLESIIDEMKEGSKLELLRVDRLLVNTNVLKSLTRAIV